MSLYEGKMKYLCFLWWGRKKKTDLRLNCLQISHDDCCNFIHLTGYYQIQKGWTKKKKKKKKISAIRSHARSHLEVDNQWAFLHTDIPITWSRQYQDLCPRPSCRLQKADLPAAVTWTWSVQDHQQPQQTLCSLYCMLGSYDRFGQSVLQNTSDFFRT